MSAFCGLSPAQVHGAEGVECSKGHSGDQQLRVSGATHLWRTARAGQESCFVPEFPPTYCVSLGQDFISLSLGFLICKAGTPISWGGLEGSMK